MSHRAEPNGRSQATRALETRIEANNRLNTVDLAAWIETHLEIRSDSRLLDLGSGTGALLLRYAKSIGPHGSCVATDISLDSLGQLRAKARSIGFHVDVRQFDMDGLADPTCAVELQNLSHITAVYSMYYSQKARHLLTALITRLNADGMIVVVGPGPGNNADWYKFLIENGAEISDSILDVSEKFLFHEVIPVGWSYFFEMHVFFATNTVTFTTASQLERYWQSNIYFSPIASTSISRAISKHFAVYRTFTITKQIGIVKMKAPRLI